MDNVMTNGFAELSALEMEEVNGGQVDVNELIRQIAYYGPKWWNYWERKGAEVYDLTH